MLHINMVKAELLDLVNANEDLTNDNAFIYQMARESNKTVLRLPPCHCELNPIELV